MGTKLGDENDQNVVVNSEKKTLLTALFQLYFNCGFFQKNHSDIYGINKYNIKQ